MARDLKKPTTYDEQITLLESRGCLIVDKVFCRQALEAIGYYRFSAYILPFKEKDERYKPETSFETVYRIYEFDRKLRRVLFSALEEVEVYLRSQLSYFHAHKYGAEGYLDPKNFSAIHGEEKFRGIIDREIENNKNASFVKHHIKEYDGRFPFWVLMELFTFGMLSYFYGDLLTSDQKQLARSIYGVWPQAVISWLRCCTDLRNICAHYGRLYNRGFPSTPTGIALSSDAEHKLWGAVMALRALYPHTRKWNSEILPVIEAIFEEYRGVISLPLIAFPEDWRDQLKK